MAKRRRDAIRKGNLPIYSEIANDLMQRIAAGDYPVGTLLPKEIDLSQLYGVSRHTMREAMRRLREAGVVSRKRRVGTEVIAATTLVAYKQPVNSVNDLLKFAEGSRVKLLEKSRVVCGRALAKMLECDIGREWLCVETLRSYPDDPRPICVTRNFLNLELLNVEEVIEDLSAPISALLEKRYGIRIVRIEQSLQAELLKTRDTKLLKTKKGTAALRSIRRYYDENARLVEFSDAIHAGDRFAYVMRLERD